MTDFPLLSTTATTEDPALALLFKLAADALKGLASRPPVVHGAQPLTPDDIGAEAVRLAKGTMRALEGELAIETEPAPTKLAKPRGR